MQRSPEPLLVPLAAWPRRLHDLPEATRPRALYVAGDLPARPCVAIVGTRLAHPEALAFARVLAGEVVRRGGVVVSGGAFGIDAAAHEGALEAGGATCAVLPTGPDRVYPEDHAPLFRAIVERGGTLVHVYPAPSRRPVFVEFFARNAVLVALSDVVVVVEAPSSSGALNAAKWARRLNRPVLAAAGAPWDERLRGSTALLLRGAAPLVSIRQVLLAAGLVGPRARVSGDVALEQELDELRAPWTDAREIPSNLSVERARAARAAAGAAQGAPPAGRRGRRRGAAQLELAALDGLPDPMAGTPMAPAAPQSDAARRVLAAVGETPLHLDAIAEKTGLSQGALAAAVLTLRLDCVLVEGPSGCFRRKSPRKTGSDGQDAGRRRVAREGEDDQEIPGVEL